MTRFGLRGSVVLASVLVLASGVVVVGIVVNVLLTRQLMADADAVLRARADAQLATVEVREGSVVVNEGPRDEALDREAWVFVAGRAIARPPAPPAIDRAASRLAAAPSTVTRNVSPEVRLRAEPVFAADGTTQAATIVVAISLAPYEESERIARLGTILLGVFVVLAGGLIAWRAVGAGLRPVQDMARRAATYGEHDLSGRFGLGPPRDELTTLAATLDSLLDRLEAGLRREQRLTAEIAHELKTPLSGIRAEAELSLRDRPSRDDRDRALRTIVAQADRMGAAIDALLSSARGLGPGTTTCDLADAVRDAVAPYRSIAEQRGVRLAVDESLPSCRVGAEEAVVVQVLGPLVDNATRLATASVLISATVVADRRVELSIRDDGPGIAEGDEARVFEPGWQTPGGSGAGLGLALARRVARSLGGEVRVDGGSRGATFVVELPVVTASGPS